MRILSVGIVRASEDSCNNAPPKHRPGHAPLTRRVVVAVRPVVGHRSRGGLVRWQLRHEVAQRLLGVEPDRGRVRPDESA